jgi:hypothetical protein
MRKQNLIAAAIAFALLGGSANAQKLDKFGAEMGKKSVMGKDVRLPYTEVISYYGYIKPGAAPDEERDGKKYYYLYVWVPAVAPEIGVRMVSPVPDKMEPAPADFIAPDYKDNMTDKTNYFDTWVSFERALDVTSAAEAATKGKTSKWISYGNNDDSGELPAQPSGSKYNSLLRIVSDASDPMKSLVTGLYRIGFTTYKTGEVQGSFVAQVGAPVKLPGVRLAKTLEEIAK